jgi:hypothetical protein
MSFMTKYSGQVFLFINLMFLTISDASLAHAIASLPLALFAGFQMYLQQKKQPDYRKDYEEKAVALQNQFVKQVAERDEFYIAEIKRISDELSRMNVTQIGAQKVAKPTYKF